MDKDEAAVKITEAAEGQNTHIEVDGEDAAGLRIKADNDEFALSIPIDNPPEDDVALRERLVEEYEELHKEGKIRRSPTGAAVMDKIIRLMGLI